MIVTNKTVKNCWIRCLVILCAVSICFVAAGCDRAATGNAASGSASNSAVSSAAAPDITLDETTHARSQTHYALYDANKQLRQLTYLDAEYAGLNETYDKATRAWYKGQYYMDLVTCGEITQESEIQDYCSKAVAYFDQAKTDANSIFDALK